jgi:hypothetical protein
MEWTAESMTRLYKLYQQHVAKLRKDVVEANRWLGSSKPHRVKLKQLTKREFEELLKEPSADVEATRLWLKRIIRGHEEQFPALDHSARIWGRGTGT